MSATRQRRKGPADNLGWPFFNAITRLLCSALRTAEALAQWMPVFEYEIDFGDVSSALAGNPGGASHVGQWNLAAGADSQRTLATQIRQAHNCGFWDEVTPEP
ncbi:MAG TPA: hypothetical protein VGY49_07895 [Burkholderiaceae bacterium]|nr:hypothetical protein [Burkholderiaceae bacterium]